MTETLLVLKTWLIRHADPQSPAFHEAIRAAERTTEDTKWGDRPDAHKQLLKHDMRFHLLLAASTGNLVVEVLLGALLEATSGALIEGIHQLPCEALAFRLHGEHRAILMAVTAKQNSQSHSIGRDGIPAGTPTFHDKAAQTV
ncbi:FCD domain-containing protein [Arthrobacter sp. R4]|uniref:FCD domain-containing protein n=1 Tax=Arthrobacter sp. R4 TaxID=644417 RepID=UPI003F5248EC